MGSVADLKDAVKETLERKGVLGKLQASVRAQVFGALLGAEDTPRPEPAAETLLINELIREHLLYNGYRDSLSVFLAESGQPQLRPFDREFLANRLRLPETPETQQVPLLYHLVARQEQQPAPAHQQQQQAEGAAGRLALPAAHLEQQQQQQDHHHHAGGAVKRPAPAQLGAAPRSNLLSPDPTVD